MGPTPSTLAQSKERKGSNFAIWQPCLQVHRRTRALRKLVKRVGENPEALSKTTLTRYVQPMATRCLFNPTFRAASELVSVCISTNAAICRTLGVSAYLKQLDRFIQVNLSTE